MLGSFPKTLELIKIAERIVWFKDPTDTLNNPIHFMSYLMTYGFYEDIKIVKKYATEQDFLYVLEHASPGVLIPAHGHTGTYSTIAYLSLLCLRESSMRNNIPLTEDK